MKKILYRKSYNMHSTEIICGLSINLWAAFSYFSSATFKWLCIRICIVRSNLLNLNISKISVVSANQTILVISTAHNTSFLNILKKNDIKTCFVGNYNTKPYIF